MKKSYTNKIIPTLIGIIITCFAIWLQLQPTATFTKILTPLDRFIYDTRLRFTLSQSIEIPPIVIIDIDEKSLTNEGAWPWPRDKIAKLLANLKDYGVAVVAFNVSFPESEKNMAEGLLGQINEKNYSKSFTKQLKSLVPNVDNNIILANMIKQHDVVLGLTLNQNANKNQGALPASLNLKNVTPDFLQNNIIDKYLGYTSNIAVIQNAGKGGAGFINNRIDDDGVIRYAPLLLQYNNQLYPSLALAAVLKYLSINNTALIFKKQNDKYAVNAITLDLLKIATNDAAEVPIHFWGQARTFPYISATDILQKNANPKSLFGTIAFIGTSAASSQNLIVTPINSFFPSVEIQASIAASLLTQQFHNRVDWITHVEFISTIVIGIIMALLLPWLNAIALLIVGISSIIFILCVDYSFWQFTQIIFSSTILLIMIFSIMLVNLIYSFAFEHRRRIYIKKMFGQYVPPEVVEEMSEHPQKYNMAGESKVLTCLFSDIRNFTTIAEKLDAAQVKELLNDIFTPLTEVIFNTQGTIDKYVGDMIMAFWGAPISDEDHAKHALKASFLMLEKLIEVNKKFSAKKLPIINIGIGLNTGEMNVGDMGSQFRKSYTVIGDAVNLASRLQELTKFYHINILASEHTQKHQTDILWRKIDCVQVKGRNRSLNIYEPICYIEKASKALLDEMKSYHQALQYYYQRQFENAEKILLELHNQHKEHYLYQLYLARIRNFKLHGIAKNWDGTFVHEHK